MTFHPLELTRRNYIIEIKSICLVITNFLRTVLKLLNLLSATFSNCNSQASLKKNLNALKEVLSDGFKLAA